MKTPKRSPRPPRARRRRTMTAEEIRAFFLACDEREKERGPEPDWHLHLRTIERSRRGRC